MTYKIEQIEGIGPEFGQRLVSAGVVTTEDLLSMCSTPEGRRQLESKTGIPEAHILKWTNQADLMRVSGVGSEYGQLLERAGVDTVKELAVRNADNLTARLASVNEEKKLTRAVPPVATVSKWIEQAQEMEAVVTH